MLDLTSFSKTDYRRAVPSAKKQVRDCNWIMTQTDHVSLHILDGSNLCLLPFGNERRKVGGDPAGGTGN